MKKYGQPRWSWLPSSGDRIDMVLTNVWGYGAAFLLPMFLLRAALPGYIWSAPPSWAVALICFGLMVIMVLARLPEASKKWEEMKEIPVSKIPPLWARSVFRLMVTFVIPGALGWWWSTSTGSAAEIAALLFFIVASFAILQIWAVGVLRQLYPLAD